MKKHWSHDGHSSLIFLCIKQVHFENLYCVVKAENHSFGSCTLYKLLTQVKLMLVVLNIFFHYWQGLYLFELPHLSLRLLTSSGSPSLDYDSQLCNKSYFRLFAYSCLVIKIYALIFEFSFTSHKITLSRIQKQLLNFRVIKEYVFFPNPNGAYLVMPWNHTNGIVQMLVNYIWAYTACIQNWSFTFSHSLDVRKMRENFKVFIESFCDYYVREI